MLKKKIMSTICAAAVIAGSFATFASAEEITFPLEESYSFSIMTPRGGRL